MSEATKRISEQLTKIAEQLHIAADNRVTSDVGGYLHAHADKLELIANDLDEVIQPSVIWYPMLEAPKSERIDILAKIWLSQSDEFKIERFTDCSWDSGDPMCNRKPSWRNVDPGYAPIAWTFIPVLPTLRDIDKITKLAIRP